MVHRVDNDNPAYPLREWDVITKIGDTGIDDQGMVHQGENLRLKFQYLIQKVARNGTVPLTVIRAGKRLQFDVPVPTQRTLLIPSLEGAYPPYFVYGPLVFERATLEGLPAGAHSGQRRSAARCCAARRSTRPGPRGAGDDPRRCSARTVEGLLGSGGSILEIRRTARTSAAWLNWWRCCAI